MDLENSVVKKDWQGELFIEIPNPPTVVYLKNLQEQKAAWETSLAETHAVIAKIQDTPEKEILSDGNLSDKPIEIVK